MSKFIVNFAEIMGKITEQPTQFKEESEEIREPEKRNCTRMFAMFLLSPNNGWKKFRNSKVTAQEFEQQTFYPLLALTAVLQFLILIYYPAIPISQVLQNAIVGFVSIFASYFAVLSIAPSILPGKVFEKSNSKFFRVFVGVSMATFDFAYLISLIAPRLRVLFWLGLIFTLYVICRGVKYLHVPQRERLTTNIMACVLICGLPLAIYAIFTLILPPV